MADLTTLRMMSGTTAPASETTTLTDTTTNNPTIEVETELYPWATSNQERRRSFIFEYYPHDPQVDIKFYLEAVSKIEQWLLGR